MANNESDVIEEVPWEFTDYKQRVLVACLLAIISISGIFGNSLVIFAVYVSRKLRNSTNVFVVNLAVADLISCLFVISNSVAMLATDGWPIEDWVCSASAAILMTCVGVSLYTLGVISFNRYVLITKSVKGYRRIFASKWNIFLWTAASWAIPICVVNVPILAGWGEVGYNKKFHTCTDLAEGVNEQLYDMIVMLGLFPIPLVTVVFCYIRIYMHVIRHAKKLAPREDSEALSTAANTQVLNVDEYRVNNSITSLDDNDKSPLPSQQRAATVSGRRKVRRKRPIATYLSKRQIEITKNLFYVLCAFVVCIIPYCVLLVMDNRQGAPFVPYAATILMINCCINWLIYAKKHPHFKHIFKCIILCRWKAIPEPIDLVREGRLPCLECHRTR